MSVLHKDFKVSFSGLAVENGEIDVNELAPALLAFGDLIQISNRAINGDTSKMTVKVKATSHGSFEILLTVSQDTNFLAQVQEFLEFAKNNKEGIESASNLVNLLFQTVAGGVAFGGGLFALLKFLKGKKPDKIEHHDDKTVQLHFGDNVFITNNYVYELAKNPQVREATEKAMKPLKSDGIDSLSIKLNENTEPLNIAKQDASYFIVPNNDEDEIVIDEMRKMTLSIISLTFKEENKWRFSNGEANFTAPIEDIEFLKRIENNEVSFAKNDFLICEVQEKQLSTPKGLRIDRIIKRVLEHRNSVKQLTLI